MQEKHFYPLYKQFDRKFFGKLRLAIKNNYKFTGDQEDKRLFVKYLIYYQLNSKDYRQNLKIVNKQLKPITDIKKINRWIEKVKFNKDTSWAIFSIDKDLIKLAKKFYRSKTKLISAGKDYNEFILRYLVSLWLAGWQAPLYPLLIEMQTGKIDLKKLNKILSLFDLTKIFN